MLFNIDDKFNSNFYNNRLDFTFIPDPINQ